MVKTILFICNHNAGRSQIAEAYFNNLNDDSSFSAMSAGTSISPNINSLVVQAMHEDGIDISSANPKVINPYTAQTAYKVYTMGCNVSCDVPLKVDGDWNIQDPYEQPISVVRTIRDEIKQKVKELLQSLSLYEQNI